VLRKHAYVVLLCDRQGVAIHHRGDEANAGSSNIGASGWAAFWSEETEGTNGIGTCIAEQRPVLVHGDQHFRTRHTRLSCAGAPVFDQHGELVAVLTSLGWRAEKTKAYCLWFSIWSRPPREPSKNACFGNISATPGPSLRCPPTRTRIASGCGRATNGCWAPTASRGTSLAWMTTSLGAVFLVGGFSNSTVRSFDRVARGHPGSGHAGGGGAWWYALFTPPLSNPE